MKIVYLNPWRQAAENQAFKSLESAAARIGCQLVHCSNSDDLLAALPDFVLATASTQPKLTSFPTYGTIHEPRDRFMKGSECYNNLLTYDGYLTISDSIHSFLKSILASLGRLEPIGYYYNSCQASSLRADEVGRALRDGTAKLTYFGTNWDKRKHRFFEKLSHLDFLEIYGPERAWRHITTGAYKGALPFDGEGPQKKYAENGLGLVLLSDEHLQNDVISNRIFEITSVGAVALCPRMPWIQKEFGDSVYYFDQAVADDELIAQISALVREVLGDPGRAMDRARRAHEIFATKFSAEQLLKNARDYHVELMNRAARLKAQGNHPAISIFIRKGSNEDALRRSLDSIHAQTAGKFETTILGRNEPLAPALQRAAGDYFCFLEAGDEWMPNHIEALLPDSPPGPGYLAITGSVRAFSEPSLTREKNLERRFIHFQKDAADPFAPLSRFLASRDLIPKVISRTGSDSALLRDLFSRCQPRFNHRATVIHHIDGKPPAPAFAEKLDRTLARWRRSVHRRWPGIFRA